MVTPKHGLTIPLGPVIIEHAGIEHSLSLGQVMALDSNHELRSSHDLIGLQIKWRFWSRSGTTIKGNPSTGKGQHWAIPLPSGETTVEVFADDDILVQWDSVTDSGQEAMPKSTAVRIANSWTKTFNLSEVS